jgi:hypothetical protein
MLNLVDQFVMIYILILIWKLLNIPTTKASTRAMQRTSPLPFALYSTDDDGPVAIWSMWPI